MDFVSVSQSALFQTSILSILNLIVQELDPKSICLSMNVSSDNEILPELTFDVPSVVMDCDHINFFNVFKLGIESGCSVSPLFFLFVQQIQNTDLRV